MYIMYIMQYLSVNNISVTVSISQAVPFSLAALFQPRSTRHLYDCLRHGLVKAMSGSHHDVQCGMASVTAKGRVTLLKQH